MITLEMVEKLRERADVTFEEAKSALERTDGDLLDALILLEREGKVNPPEAAPEREDASAEACRWDGRSKKDRRRDRGHEEDYLKFKSLMRKMGRFLLRVLEIGNSNSIEATKNGSVILSCPVTVFVILLIFFFWVVVPLVVLSVFFGWKYRVRGPELGRDDVNAVIEKAEAAAEELRGSFSGGRDDDAGNDDTGE
jgi:hypothetical protein